MKYTEITVHTTTLGSELVSDIFWQFTEDGVAISDVNDVIALSKAKRGTWDYIDEKLLAPAEVLCKGYVPADDERTKSAVLSALRRLKESAAVPVGTLETVQREVEGDAWIETWKEHFRPFNIGKVVVCPAWLDHAPKAGETTVKIDTFMAFGTGEHETTSMCVELLQEFMRPGDRDRRGLRQRHLGHYRFAFRCGKGDHDRHRRMCRYGGEEQRRAQRHKKLHGGT